MPIVSLLVSLALALALQAGWAQAQAPVQPQAPAPAPAQTPSQAAAPAQAPAHPVAGNLGLAQSGVATARQELAALQREVVKHLYATSQHEQTVLRTGHVDLLAKIQETSLVLTDLGDVLAIYDAVPRKTDVVVKSRVLNRVEAAAKSLNDAWIVFNAFEKQNPAPTSTPGGLTPMRTRFGEILYKAVVSLNPLLQELNAY